MKIDVLPIMNSVPSRVDFGARVYFARIACGLSQKELALQVGYKSATAIHLIEKNKRGLDVRTLQLIAHVTAKPITYFFDN